MTANAHEDEDGDNTDKPIPIDESLTPDERKRRLKDRVSIRHVCGHTLYYPRHNVNYESRKEKCAQCQEWFK